LESYGESDWSGTSRPRRTDWGVGTEKRGELTLALSVFGTLMADVSTACG
jgi:hypothetical protein